MDHGLPPGDPIPDRTTRPVFPSYAARAADHSPDVCAELDRYDIAVTMPAAAEWGAYRYTNACDAIAAAKREQR